MIRLSTNTLKYILMLLVTAGFLHAQEAQSFSLEEAKEYAKKNNYDVQKAKLAIGIANKQKWQVTATGFPQVSFNIQYNRLLDIPVTLIPAQFFGGDSGKYIAAKFALPHNASFGFTITQLIFNGSYIVGLQASRTYSELSEQAFEKTKLDAGESIAQTYFLILLAEENKKILSTSLENITKTYDEIKEMNKEGFVEATDVSQMQISVNQLKTQLNSVGEQIDVAYKMLKLQMGIEINEPITLTDNLATLLAESGIDKSLKTNFNVEENIGFKILLTQERLADLSLRNEYSKFLPTISAFATIEKNAIRKEFNFFDTDQPWYKSTIVGLQLSWPIFSGGQKIFNIQKAELELEQAELDRRKAEQGLQLQFTQARSALRTAYDSYQNAQENKQLANEVYEINLEKYKEGIISSLDLVQAHNQYLQAEGAYLMSASQLLTARTTLDKLLNEI